MHPAYPTDAALRAEAHADRETRAAAASNAVDAQIDRLGQFRDEMEFATSEAEVSAAEAAAEALKLGVDALLASHRQRLTRRAAA